MATIGEVSRILITGARAFTTTSLFRDACDGELLSTPATQAFLKTYLDTIDEKFDAAACKALHEYAEEYAPEASASILRNTHMNNARGNYRDAENMLAILVDFINYAVMPMDLALYTTDIGLPDWVTENQGRRPG